METLLSVLMYMSVLGFILVAGWFVAFWIFSTLAYCMSWVYSKRGKYLDVSGCFMVGYLVLVIFVLSPVVGIAAKNIFLGPLSFILGLMVLYHTEDLWIINPDISREISA